MADETSTTPLIRTKLHRPPVAKNYVHRPHLLHRLSQRLQRPTTLVSAPAGYGKTALLSCWLEACDSPSAWVSLDQNDNDVRLFLRYFLAAIQTMFPDVGRKTLALVNTFMLPSISVLVGSLVNDLHDIDRPFILVLDDYHHIREESVHHLLTELLRHPPQPMHLVLISRRDPQLPIFKLRAQSLITEIRTQDLRFSRGETKTFLEQLLGTQVDTATAASLEKKTEGWVTGLRLVAISMRQSGNLNPKLLEPHVDSQYVMEYLFNEAFSQQAPEISQYLMGTAILDRFCAPLCEAVCAPDVDPSTCEIGGWEFISWLNKENMFLIPLDAQNRWFRFHHLYKKLLLNQLKSRFSSEDIHALHARASAWFAEEGLIEEAIEHALSGGEIPAAVKLVAKLGHQLMNDQQWPRLERWLGLLPRDRVEQDPELLMLEAWLNHVRTNGIDVLDMATFLEKVETLLYNLPAKGSTSATQVKGHFDALRGFHLFMSADGENALKHTQSACENIPTHHHRARVFAHIFQVGSYQMVGDFGTGLSIYHNEVKKSIKLGGDYHAMYLANLCYVYWIDADLINVQQAAERSLKAAMDSRMSEAIAFSLYFLGIASYHQNNLQIAEEKLTTMIEDFYFYNPVNFAHSSFALALIYQAKGKIGKARKVIEDLVKYAIDTNNQDVLLVTRAFDAELALRQGRLAEAAHWARRFHAKPFLPPYCFYMPQLTLIKILMAKHTTDSRHQAADLLDQLNDFLASIHNIHFRIHVLALQALYQDTRGRKSAALEKLTEALNLAEPGGYIRLFVDLGLQMADLLKRLASQNVAMGYIGRILAAFSSDEYRVAVDESGHPGTHPSYLSSQPLFEALTNRELEVLELLAQRLRNKEIAAKLFISEETVKKHLNRTYRKLNVTSRRQAVEKGQAMGVFSRA